MGIYSPRATAGIRNTRGWEANARKKERRISST